VPPCACGTGQFRPKQAEQTEFTEKNQLNSTKALVTKELPLDKGGIWKGRGEGELPLTVVDGGRGCTH